MNAKFIAFPASSRSNFTAKETGERTADHRQGQKHQRQTTKQQRQLQNNSWNKGFLIIAFQSTNDKKCRQLAPPRKGGTRLLQTRPYFSRTEYEEGSRCSSIFSLAYRMPKHH